MVDSDKTTSDSGSSDSSDSSTDSGSDSSSSSSSDGFKVQIDNNPKIKNSGDREAEKVPENSHQKFQEKIKSFQDNKKRKLDTNNNYELNNTQNNTQNNSQNNNQNNTQNNTQNNAQNNTQNNNTQNLTKLSAENKTLRETVFSLSKILANSGSQLQNSDSSSKSSEISEIERLKESVVTKDSKIEILSGLVTSLRKENSEILKESVYEKSRSKTLEKTVNTQKQIIEILKKGGSDLEKHVDFCETEHGLRHKLDIKIANTGSTEKLLEMDSIDLELCAYNWC